MAFRLFFSWLFFGIVTAPGATPSNWIRMRGSAFEMYSSANERTTRDTLRFFEQVRGFFDAHVAVIPSATPLRIVLFGSLQEYEPYRPNAVAAAYYRNGGSYDYIVISQPSAGVLPAAVHEYVHRLVRQAGLTLPPWLDEGVAELYSTLRHYGGQIRVGDLIPGRHQAALRERWTPLAVILAAGHDSPYYNEKNKAGSLYNEGWALTHMLALSEEYRPSYPRLVQAIAGGMGSAEALEKVYGKPLAKIERDLQAYLRGNQFRAALFPGKLAQVKLDAPAEPVAEFDVLLLQADLSNHPERRAEARARFQKLAALNALRPEPQTELGYLAWQENDMAGAYACFRLAYELGSRRPQFLWDYGRMALAHDPALAVAALEDLLKQEPQRAAARQELELARQRVEAARAAQEALKAAARVRPATPAPEPAEAGPPRLKRGEPREEFKVFELNKPPAARPAADGMLVRVDCMGPQARLHVDAAGARRVFLIDQPNDIIVEGSTDGHANLQCGPQKGRRVHVEYDAPLPAQTGVAGRLRLLRFQR